MEKKADFSFNQDWDAIQNAANSPFAHSQLLNATLWHDRPKTAVYRMEVADNGTAPSQFYYYKIYKLRHDTARREFSALQQIESAFEKHSDIGCIKPILFIESRHAFISAEFIGTDLYRLLKSHASLLPGALKKVTAEDAFTKLARWIATFQQGVSAQSNVTFSLHTLHEHALKDLGIARESGMIASPTYAAALALLNSLREKLSQQAQTLVASNVDAKLWNFLYTPGRLNGLDFVGFGAGLPALDVARLATGINWLKIFPLLSSQRINAIEKFFIDKCRQQIGFSDDELLFCRLCIQIELTAFYSTIRTDKYRRKLRNRLFFFIIRRFMENAIRRFLVQDNNHV